MSQDLFMKSSSLTPFSASTGCSCESEFNGSGVEVHNGKVLLGMLSSARGFEMEVLRCKVCFRKLASGGGLEMEEFVRKVSSGKITGFGGMGLDVLGCDEQVAGDLFGKVDGVNVSAGKMLLGSDVDAMKM